MTAMGFTRVAPLPITSVIAVHDADQKTLVGSDHRHRKAAFLSLPRKRRRRDCAPICAPCATAYYVRGVCSVGTVRRLAERADVALEGVPISAGERDRPRRGAVGHGRKRWGALEVELALTVGAQV